MKRVILLLFALIILLLGINLYIIQQVNKLKNTEIKKIDIKEQEQKEKREEVPLFKKFKKEYDIEVIFATLDFGILNITLKNTGSKPLNLSRFFMETPEGNRYYLEDGILKPGEEKTISIYFPEMCYEYSTYVLLSSDYYNISKVVIIYCR